MTTTQTCEQIIGFDQYTRSERDRALRKTLIVYTCPKCKAVHKIVKSWTGRIPPGGFVCGR